MDGGDFGDFGDFGSHHHDGGYSHSGHDHSHHHSHYDDFLHYNDFGSSHRYNDEDLFSAFGAGHGPYKRAGEPRPSAKPEPMNIKAWTIMGVVAAVAVVGLFVAHQHAKRKAEKESEPSAPTR